MNTPRASTRNDATHPLPLPPQCLFYGRILAEIVGRLVPRRRALLVTSPGLLLGGAAVCVALSGAFFAYLQARRARRALDAAGTPQRAPVPLPPRPGRTACRAQERAPAGFLYLALSPAPRKAPGALSASGSASPLCPPCPVRPQAPSRFIYDPASLVLVALLWAVGGYIK
jgi:hypothetical protein